MCALCGRLDSPIEVPEINFLIPANAVSIFLVKVTKTLMTLFAETSPSCLTSSSNNYALLTMSPGVPIACWRRSKHSIRL